MDTLNGRLAQTRIAARCFVYNLASYRLETAYGPFLADSKSPRAPVAYTKPPL